MSEVSSDELRWSRLAWDTAFFGFPIGRVFPTRLAPTELERACHWAADEKLRCLYWLADGSDPRLATHAQSLGFRFSDLRIDLSLASLTARAPDERVRPAVARDLVHLRRIASATQTDTRFAKDPGFPSARVSEFYAHWIQRDFDEHQVFAACSVEASDHPVGFISTQLEAGKQGRIGLFSVDPAFAGRGLGRALLDAAINWFASHECTSVNVATQATNVAAQRVYQNAGFRPVRANLWFHRWF